MAAPRLMSALPLLLAACATPPAPPTAAPLPGTHRVAAVQYEIRAGRAADAVIAEAVATVAQAAAHDAELVVFPELFLFDVWPDALEDEAAYVREVAEQVTPRLQAGLAEAARTHQVAVLLGSAPELRDGALYNTAHLYFPDGRDVRQDKVYLTAWGKKVGMTPGAGLEVFDAPWGKSVILVCYDVEIPALSQGLVTERPEVLLVPSMTESEHGLYRVRWAAQARAVEHHAYVVVAGTVGTPSPTWRHYGQAAMLTPRDAGFAGVLAEGPRDRPAVVYGDLDIEKLRTSRAEVTFYPAEDQRQRAADAP